MGVKMEYFWGDDLSLEILYECKREHHTMFRTTESTGWQSPILILATQLQWPRIAFAHNRL